LVLVGDSKEEVDEGQLDPKVARTNVSCWFEEVLGDSGYETC